MRSLRAALGPEARIAVDMHWSWKPDEALALNEAMEPYGPWFAEAPVETEDLAGLAEVAALARVPIAVGEEWRTVYDMQHRVERCQIGIVQPEMGHTGITSFIRIGECAASRGIDVGTAHIGPVSGNIIPHATIGAGVFLAASLQASAAIPAVVAHEYQHSIFEPNRRLVQGGMDCANGAYSLPAGPGIGVEPSEEAIGLLRRL